MSGGHWEYKNDSLAHEIFGWGMDPDYGEDGFSQSRLAATINPLEDAEMSEMLWDMLCVLHSYDWYACSDTCEETYRRDVKRFKEKWLGKPTKARVQRIADHELERVKEVLYKTFGLEASDAHHQV